MIALSDYLLLGAVLFSISVAGIFLNRKNVIVLLMCIELMLLAVNMNFVAFSHFLQDGEEQIVGIQKLDPVRSCALKTPVPRRRAALLALVQYKKLVSLLKG